jgi:hypothetical protein
MLLSVQARNFLVGHGGDIVVRMYLFWSLFLPTADYYSVDAVLKSIKKRKNKPSAASSSHSTKDTRYTQDILLLHLLH